MKRPYEYHIWKKVTKRNPTQPFHVTIEYRGEVVYRGEKKANKRQIISIARRENQNRIKPYKIIDHTGKVAKELKAV